MSSNSYSLNPCDEPKIQSLDIKDNIPSSCEQEINNLNNVPFLDTEESIINDNVGKSAACSPMQSGKIINDPDSLNRGIINRYSPSVRGTDMAVKDLFDDVYVIGVNGQSVKVPIIFGPGEKAVIAALNLPGSGVRHDNSLVVDRVVLPIMSLYSSGMTYNDSRYTWELTTRPTLVTSEKFPNDTVYATNRGVPVDREYILTAWTLYLEDMDQMLTIILNKINRMTYIKVQGIDWEIPVRLTGIANNVTNDDIGDTELRVIKYQFTMTAETYIAQPIIRGRTVRKVITDYVAGTPENITSVDFTTKETVEDLNQC